MLWLLIGVCLISSGLPLRAQWTTGSLSEPRRQLAAAAAGSKVLFGGGLSCCTASSNFYISNAVDVYDVNLGTWSKTALSQNRTFLWAAAAGSKVLFAGGNAGSPGTIAYSAVVDLYHTNS